MAEKEYIERKQAYEIIRRTSGDYATACAEIRKLPSADVVPVMYGAWEPFDDSYDVIKCSECGKCFEVGDRQKFDEFKKTYRFCPICGAEMEGGKIYESIHM